MMRTEMVPAKGQYVNDIRNKDCSGFEGMWFLKKKEQLYEQYVIKTYTKDKSTDTVDIKIKYRLVITIAKARPICLIFFFLFLM